MQGLKFILNQYRETTANMNVEKSYAKVYRIDISFDNNTIYLEPKEGYTLSNKTVEGVRRAIDKRNDVKSRFSAEAKSLIPESCITEPVNLGNTSDGLKMKMSYQEMEEHMRNNSWKNVNRVNVGLYAKRLGYEVYKPMINGQIFHFYVNEQYRKLKGSI